MDSTHFIGLLLVGFSAVMLASHWQQRRKPECHTKNDRHRDQRRRDFTVRTLRRRTVASSLVGIVGFTLIAFETVPQTPLAITAYLFSLVLMTCWILWLALLDLLASRRFQEDLQLDQIADELRPTNSGHANFGHSKSDHSKPKPARADSAKK